MTSVLAKETWDNVMASHSSIALEWGPTNIDRFLGDPKRIAFFMSRYKFAGKMLRRCKSILDVGCGDGMGSVSFLSDTDADQVLGLDFEPKVIDYATEKLLPALHVARPDAGKLSFTCQDFTLGVYPTGIFDGLCCLDVIEHIDPNLGDDFIDRMASTLTQNGVAVVGTPNGLAAQYGSVHSQIGHINLYDPERFRRALEARFLHVFAFSMNDEIVHTGFDKLAHYLMAVCVR